MVNRILGQILDQLFPQRCVFCDLPSGCTLPLCPTCRGDLQANMNACLRCALPLPGLAKPGRECGQCLASAPDFDRAQAPWLYDDMLAHLIHRWKFSGEHQLSPVLANLWLQSIPEPPTVDVIVPMPLHWRRRWRRGYNQAALLSHELRRQCPALTRSEISRKLLVRQRATAPQSGMHAAARHRNLRGAFTVCQPCDNLRLAVVDDVLTTGATANAAAAALRNAGAQHIEIWCLARTPIVNK